MACTAYQPDIPEGFTATTLPGAGVAVIDAWMATFFQNQAQECVVCQDVCANATGQARFDCSACLKRKPTPGRAQT